MSNENITIPFLGNKELRKRKRKYTFLSMSIAVIALLLIAVVTISSAYVFSNFNSEAFFQPPPLQLINSNTSGVATTIGINNTWANVTVKASTNYEEITRNGGFDSGPNEWLYGTVIYNGSAITGAYWNQTYSFASGASGIVLLYMRLYSSSGTIFNYVNGSIYLVQNITIPNTTISSVTLNVTYYFEYQRNRAILSSYYIFAELLYPNGSVAWNDEQLLNAGLAGSWNNATFTIPSTDVTPGETYTLLVGARVDGYTINLLWWVGNLTVYQLFDSVRLYVRSLYPSFSGSILDLNVTNGAYNTLLEVSKLTVLGGTNVNLSIFVANLSGGSSTPITVSGGTLTSSTTSSVRFTVPPSGYTSGYVYLSAAIYPTSVVNIPLKIVYGIDGVTVTYHINVTIVDPSSHDASPNSSSAWYGHFRKHVSEPDLLKELKRLESLLLSRTLHGLVPLQRWRG